MNSKTGFKVLYVDLAMFITTIKGEKNLWEMENAFGKFSEDWYVSDIKDTGAIMIYFYDPHHASIFRLIYDGEIIENYIENDIEK